MDIYTQLCSEVEQGHQFAINFKTRSLSVNGKKLVDNGKMNEPYGFNPSWDKEYVEELFNKYYYSIPSERASNHNGYFLAASFDELTDEQLIKAGDRMLAQAKLEGVILGLILENCPFTTFDINNRWFWQSQNNKHLIILKEWFNDCTNG